LYQVQPKQREMKKRLTPFLLMLLLTTVVNAQTMHSYLKERAEKNLEILAKSPSIRSRVKIDNQGIALLNDQQRTEVSAKWVEISKVINVLETRSYYEMLRIFENKGTQTFTDASAYSAESHYRTFPTEFENLFVCIDPGHFGGTKEASQMEARIVKIAAGDLGTKNDVIFTEADLAYCTALFLKQLLEERGAIVMITRPYGAGAVGEDFSSWISNGGIMSAANNALYTKDITPEYFNQIKAAYTTQTTTPSRNELFRFYKFIDFKTRAQKINDFNPNITISIHYNADDDNKFYGDRYLHPVDDNYNMMFIPGAFMAGEIDKQDQKLDFLRLLLSPDLENSINLADYILEEHQKILGVERRINLDPESRMAKSVIFTEKNGVFARNLVLTRMVRGTVVYGESLLQDNVKEAILLGKKDIVAHDPSFGDIPTSSRTKQVAQAYFNGIIKFLDENKKKTEYMKSLKASIK
jgi:N-acetylmuramoyl-L-alanine amidase